MFRQLFLIFGFLFTSATFAQTQTPAVWTEKPVPHWGCTHVMTELVEVTTPVQPYCVGLDERQIHRYSRYNPHTEELIRWTWTKTVPKGGILRVDYPAGFLRMPGCDISGDEQAPVKFVGDPTKDGFTIRGKVGQVLNFKCLGVIERK